MIQLFPRGHEHRCHRCKESVEVHCGCDWPRQPLLCHVCSDWALAPMTTIRASAFDQRVTSYDRQIAKVWGITL